MSSISKTGAAHSIIQEAECKRAEPAKKSGKAVEPAPFERNLKLADQFLEHVSTTPPKSTKDLDQIFLKSHGDHHKLQTSPHDETHTCCDLGFTYSALRERVDREEADREFLTTSPYAKSIAIPILGTRGSLRTSAQRLLRETRQTQEVFQKKYEEHLDLCRPKAHAHAHEWVKAQPVIQEIIKKQKAGKKYEEIFKKSYEVNIKNFDPEYAAKMANRLVESQFMKNLKAQPAYINLFQGKYEELLIPFREEAFAVASEATVSQLASLDDCSPRSSRIENARAAEAETPKIVADISDQILMDLIGDMIPELNAIDAGRQTSQAKDTTTTSTPPSHTTVTGDKA